MIPADVPAWLRDHGQWIATAIAAGHLYTRNLGADVAGVRAIGYNLLGAARLAKGSPMNALQLIPLALADAGDVQKLVTACQAGDKAGATAAILDTIPLIAAVTGRTEDQLRATLTAERIGVAFDLAEALPAVVTAIEKAIPKAG